MSEQALELQKEYALRFSEMAAYRTAVWKILIKHYFQSKIGRDRVVLDLGSGWGEFINQIEARAKFAMDLNPDGRIRVNPDVTFLEQDCSKPWNVAPGSLDVVFTSNFFEHLPTKDSLLATLREAHRSLRPGGRLFCLGPNIRYVDSAYWDFFDHHLALSHLSLVEALRLADFSIEETIPRFLPYTMADGKRPPLAGVAMYLKVPLAWPILGKQFFITASR